MSSKTQHSIKYIGAKIWNKWNNIPSDLKHASYKNFLLSTYKN